MAKEHRKYGDYKKEEQQSLPPLPPPPQEENRGLEARREQDVGFPILEDIHHNFTYHEHNYRSDEFVGIEEFLGSIWSTDNDIRAPNPTTTFASGSGGVGVDKHTKFGLNASSSHCIESKDEVTPGTMTLDDFFIKAGVVSEVSKSCNIPVAPLPPLPIIGQPHHQVTSVLQSRNTENESVLGDHNLESYQLSSVGSKLAMEMNERAEQRRRKMMKNRESAARSRARKQVYELELQLEIKRLKEENARLRQKKDWGLDHNRGERRPNRNCNIRRRNSCSW